MKVKLVSSSITRPANTTAYASGDVVTGATAAAFSFPELGQFSGSSASASRLVQAVLYSSQNAAVKLTGLIYWFYSNITDLDADNAAFTPTDAQLATCFLVSTVSSSWVVGDPAVGDVGNCLFQIPIDLPIAGTQVYAVLVATNAYAPLSAEVLTLSLTAQTEA